MGQDNVAVLHVTYLNDVGEEEPQVDVTITAATEFGRDRIITLVLALLASNASAVTSNFDLDLLAGETEVEY